MKHSDAATLADSVYNTPILNKPNNGYKKAHDLGWEFLASTDDLGLSKEGYFAAAFKKDNQIIIAHRGTDKLNDINDDIQIWHKCKKSWKIY